MEQGGGDNVIYVQVDEQGRVLNYTSNISGGEQVILLQDSGTGQQPVLVEAPSTSVPATSQLAESITFSSKQQPNLEQHEEILQQPVAASTEVECHPEPQVTTVNQPSMSVSGSTVVNRPEQGVQQALVDQSGTPVMLVGRPEAVSSATKEPVKTFHTVSASDYGGQAAPAVSSQVVDQSGVPVVVLGQAAAPRPKTTAAPGISIVSRPQIITQVGAGGASIIKKPAVQRSLVQGQRVVSQYPRVSMPGTAVLISKQGKTFLATPKPIGQPSIASHKIGQSSSNIIKSPMLTTHGGPVILSAKPTAGISQAGVSNVVVVSRPQMHVQISNSPMLISKQKSSMKTPGSGLITFSPSMTVTQPVLTVIKERQSTVDTAKIHQGSEVTSTVNGGEHDIGEAEPIEIPDTDDEDLSKEKAEQKEISSNKETETEEVLQDVTMNEAKEDEKSEEELMEETSTTTEQKDTESSEEKVQQDMDNDLLMYLGGDSVKQDDEKQEVVTSMVDSKEDEVHKNVEYEEEVNFVPETTTEVEVYQAAMEVKNSDVDEEISDKVDELSDEVEVSDTIDEEVSSKMDEEVSDKADEKVSDEADEEVSHKVDEEVSHTVDEEVSDKADEVSDKMDEEQQVESTTVTDEEFEEFEDSDDGALPAGLIRGEPIQTRPRTNGTKDIMQDHAMENDKVEKEISKEACDATIADVANVSEKKSLDKEIPNKEVDIEKNEDKPENKKSQVKDTISDENKSTPDGEKEPQKHRKRGRPLKTTETKDIKNTPIADDTPSKSLQKKGRGRKLTKKKDAMDSPEDANKKSFMANFNLVSPREMEKLSQRRSKRVSNAEAVKQKDDEVESTNAAGSKIDDALKSEMLKKSETPHSYKSYKTLDDDSSSRQNIFELFDAKDAEKDDSMGFLKARIQKLLAVNAELKSRLRESDHKAASSHMSNARFHEIKALQHKVEKLEKKNMELSQRLESYEGKPSPPERTVDVSFRMGRLSFKSPIGTAQSASSNNTVGISPGKPKPSEAQENPASAKLLEKKELKLRALDQELDQRTAILKTKEGKLQRVAMDVKSREKKVEYQEKAIERRVKDIEYRERMLEGKTKAALEKMNKDGGVGHVKGQAEDSVRSAEMKRFEQELEQRKLKEREKTLKEREDAVAEKEKYIEVTEKELAALGADLKEQFHSIQATGKASKLGKLPSKILGKGRPRKSTVEEQRAKVHSGSDKKVEKPSVVSTPTSTGRSKGSHQNRDQSVTMVAAESSPVLKKRSKKTVKDEDSASNISSERSDSVSTSSVSGRKGRPAKKVEDLTQLKTPKNLIIDMVDKPLSARRGGQAVTRRSIGTPGKATTTPTSTLRKRTRTVSPAPVTKPVGAAGKKFRK